MKNIAIILSAGSGQRFNDNLPKQYHKINDRMVVEYVIDEVKKSKLIDDVVFVASNFYLAIFLCEQYGMRFVEGGKTRSISIANGLDYIKEHYPNVEKIIVFDSARPFVKSYLISEYMDLLDEYDGVITTCAITDSLGDYENNNINRDNYYLIQAPEAFKFRVIYEYFDRNSSITSMVQQLPVGSNIYQFFDFPNNMKITYHDDLEIARVLMSSKEDDEE